MSHWPSIKAARLLAALKRIGWTEKRQPGTSHLLLERQGWQDYTFAFHQGTEVGPKMLSKVAKKTGLKPTDL